MSFLVFEFGIALVMGLVGAGIGYWLRGPRVPPADAEEGSPQRLANQTLARLHDLAATVAADVGAHRHRVQEINNELNEGEQTSDSLLQAMSKLIQANERMQRQLDSAEDQIEQQARQMQSFEAQARTDALTGIANRRAFDDFTRRQQSEFLRHGRPVTVMMMDVDRFKIFNDTYGHQAGDAVLAGVARLLTKTMRDVDLVARYGGEEFSVVFPGSRLVECGPASQRARAAIEDAVFHHEGQELKVTASFGLAELRSGETIAETVKRADEALYAAKKAGRNNAHWHDGETSHPVASAAPPAAAEPSAREHAAEEPGFEVPGISSRESFVHDVSRRVAEWRRTGTPLSLILLAIDDLPKLSQTHGKQSSQVVVRTAAQFLKAAMREMDHVGRYGEDAFGLLLPSAPLAAAELIAQRLRKAIARCSLPLGGVQLRFTACLGVAEARQGEDGQGLLNRAEQALVQAQAAGANRAFVHHGTEGVAAKSASALADA